MPRAAREKSESGIYHIILRGANRQEIFYDDEDCIRFLETLDRYKREKYLKVFGWCLMQNHIHLLISEGNEDMSNTFKRVGISYALYFNRKYGTTGHLFQDRFRSEKIENVVYMLTVIRYIHLNPVKAGIAITAAEWKWSSCNGYYGNSVYPRNLLDKELILRIFSEETEKAVKMFIDYNEAKNEDICLDYEGKKRLSDVDALKEIKKLLSVYEIPQIKSLPKSQRDDILKKLKEIEGLSQRQAARILGISANLVFKA